MPKVTDPALLQQLNGQQPGGMVQISPSDPKLPGQVAGQVLSNEQARVNIEQDRATAPWVLRKQKADALEAEAKLKKQTAKTQLTPQKLKDVRIDALNKIILARKLKDRSRNDWFATGFLAPTMSKMGGTSARGVQAGADTLKSGGALSEVLKLTAANGGKIPFAPMSNSDVELISRNVANLDVGQPDADFQAAVQQYEDAYRRAFIGAKGSQKALRDALVKLGLEKGQAKSTANDGWSIEEVR